MRLRPRHRPLVRPTPLLTAVLLALPVGASALRAQARAVPRASQPVIVVGQTATVAVGAADVLLAASGDSATIARALAACRVASADADVFSRQLAAGDDVARADHVVFIVVPEASVRSACSPSLVNGAALIARGIRVAVRPLYDEQSDLRDATVLVRGGPATVEAVHRRPTILATESAETPDARVPTSLVLLVPVEAAAPDARGRVPSLELRVASVDRAAPPERFAVSASQVRTVWYQLLPARLALMSDEPAVPAPTRLPAPVDDTLREAHARYGEGRMVESARAAAALLAAGTLSRDDQRVARLMVANALLVHHDTSAARVVLADVLADTPCLTFTSASAAYARMLHGMRGAARCTAMPLGRVALASLVPGLGEAVTGRRKRALAVGGGTVLLAAAGIALRSTADQRYDEYRRALTIDQATLKYDRAMEFRNASGAALGVAGALWLFGGVDAVRAERAHQRDVRRLSDYDAPVAARVRPDARVVASTGALAVGVALAW